MLKIKRIYDIKPDDDGYRILVDRLWPRGISKQIAALQHWNSELAPSTELRQWFNHKPEKLFLFMKSYKA